MPIYPAWYPHVGDGHRVAAMCSWEAICFSHLLKSVGLTDNVTVAAENPVRFPSLLYKCAEPYALEYPLNRQCA